MEYRVLVDVVMYLKNNYKETSRETTSRGSASLNNYGETLSSFFFLKSQQNIYNLWPPTTTDSNITQTHVFAKTPPLSYSYSN